MFAGVAPRIAAADVGDSSERIRANTEEWLGRLSKRDDVLHSQAAVMVARTRLDAASTFRRAF